MAGEVRITEVNGYFARRKFVRLPWKIYKGDTNWVPPLLLQVQEMLDTRKNVFYKRADMKLFLAEKHGEPVGRIAAIVNHAHNEFHNEKTGMFGFFECIDDQKVADALFDAAGNWLKSQGMQIILGPNNPSTNHECALLVEGFDEPAVLMMTYNPPYYPRLIENCGLSKAMDTLAYKLDFTAFSEKVIRSANRLAKRKNISVRSVDPKNFDRDVEIIHDVYNRAWEKNWGFVPVNDEEFAALVKDMKQIYDPSMALIGDVDGEPAAFSLTLPNINEVLIRMNGRLFPFGIFKLLKGQRNIQSARNLLLGVVPEHRKVGIDILMYVHAFEAASRRGCTWGEMSWILENNENVRPILEKIGGYIYKTYRFYSKPL